MAPLKDFKSLAIVVPSGGMWALSSAMVGKGVEAARVADVLSA